MADCWIAPMLAHDLKEDAVLDDPSFACEEKVDGVRVQIQLDEGRAVSVLSRNKKPVGGIGLAWLDRLDGHGLTAVVDGELYVEGGRSSDVAHHVAADLPLRVALFDVLSLNSAETWSLPYSLRRELVRFVVARIDSDRIRAVATFPFARAAFQMAKETGAEGVMLKRLDASYAPGKRSWNWQKVKCITEIDVVITDCESRPTKWTVRPGHVGRDGILYPDGKLSSTWQAGHTGISYGFWDPERGQAVRVGSLGVTGPRSDMELLVGRVARVKFYSIEARGRLRHPVLLEIRSDKEPSQCLAFQPEEKR